MTAIAPPASPQPASPESSSPNPAPKKFRFDQKLWRQFIDVAQPYFYPVEPYSTRRFLTLLTLQLVLVMGLTFFMVVGLALLGLQFFADFFKRMIDDVNFLGFLKNYVTNPNPDPDAEFKLASLTDVSGQVLSGQIIGGLVQSPVFYLALGALVIGFGAFYVTRRKLKQRWLQWFLLGVLLFLAFVVSGLNVVISYAFRFIDNSFVKFAEAKGDSAAGELAKGEFWQFLTVYGIILLIAIPILISYVYLRQKLALFWRKWLTNRFLSKYFKDRAYYELDSNAANTEIDNPDQRITEDIYSFTVTVLDFLLDILGSILDLIAFTGILYGISKQLTLGLAGYVTLGTVLAVVIGTRLIKINFDQLRLEADFRYGMVHVRDNAESIAFYRGEELENQQVSDRLKNAIRNFDLKIIWLAYLGVFQRAYNYFARLVPYAIVAPLFFAGTVEFGVIGQGVFAFSMVLSALSLITNRIQEISAFAASIERVGALYEHLETETEGARGSSEQQTITTHLAPQFRIQDLTLKTPNGEQTLFQNLSLTLEPDESLLIVGASGCGKSSMMRALAGLWKNGSGTIERPDNSEILFLPQKPYMLLGTLREQLVYPNMRSNVADREIQAALTLVNLEHLPERVGGLGIERDWPSVLSLGEQQRLAFARILLNQPKYVMLDEATSALDVPNERRLYELLRSLDILYISVGHRPSLRDYHRKVLEICVGEQGWQVSSAEAYRFQEI
ncbi:MAG: ABC transporter ATP-binding protein/permease [Synechococcales cyanobacterium CRU_2_2]|nr:ABC transporter ATP-binding protein/permease [Synechococcales cyanobacterium CRU_2_2]